MNEEQEGHIQRKLILCRKNKKKKEREKRVVCQWVENAARTLATTLVSSILSRKMFFSPQSDAFEHPEESSGSHAAKFDTAHVVGRIHAAMLRGFF